MRVTGNSMRNGQVLRRSVLAAVAVCVVTLGCAASSWAASASQRCEMLYSKGLARLHSGDYAAARELFDAAVQADPADAHALYYRATARGRMGDYAGAAEDLRAALEHDPSLDQAALDLGYVLLKLGRYDEATEYLEDARSRPRVAPQAEILLRRNEKMQQAGAGGGRRYHLMARLGLEYDSNVQLAPSDDPLRISLLDGDDEADGRMVADAAAVYSVYRSQALSFSLRYDLATSVHFDLDEFDMQTHRLSGDLAAGTGALRYGVTGSYAYSINDGDSFLLEASGVPWLRVLERDFGHTDFYYRLWTRDVLDDTLSPLSDALNNAVGVRQFVYLGRTDRYLLAGYRYDHDEPQHSAGSPFEYDGHQFEAGLGWTVMTGLRGEAIYAYKAEDYPDSSTGREDDEHTFWIRAEKDLADWAMLVAAYTLRVNDSNDEAFDYDRHIASLAIELSY